MRHSFVSFTIAVAAVGLIACFTDPRSAAAEPPAAGDHGAVAAGQASAATPSVSGKVAETMDAGSYTYVQVDDGAKKVWAAAPKFKVAVGDKVIVPAGMPMRDFHSPTLKRTFDVVYFVQSIQVIGGKEMAAVAAAHGGKMPGASLHGGLGKEGDAAAVDLANIKKAEGGQTVAELFADKAKLVGKEVAVRGKVVKYTPQVMGKNWIHLRDGTGGSGTDDLAVTTSADAKVGDTVLVRGKLSGDKDFGFGYKYDVMIEDATVKVE